ncbi:MAG: hypothetical protein PUF72_08090 [Clostridiales bacterium]|nr:hypothetical protein [Clostridiales bacterium]
MDCSEFQKMLGSYEELDEEKRSEMDKHAAECDGCRSELEFYKSVINAVSTLPKMKAPESLLNDINARIDKEEKKQTLWKHLRKYGYRYGAAAACIALVAVVGVRNSELVDRMMKHDNGVISESGSISEDTEPFFTQGPQRSEKPAPTVEAVKPTQTAKPADKAVKTPEAVRPTAKPTAKPTEVSIPTMPPKVTARPTATLSPKAAYVPTSAPAVSGGVIYSTGNTVTEAPKPAAETAPVSAAAQQASTQTPEETAAAQNNEAQAYTIEQNGYKLPEEEEPQAYAAGSTSEDYSVKQGRGAMTSAYATLIVSSQDEERVRELIDIYSSDSDGDSYTIDPDRMKYMLEVFKQEGIEYNDSLTEVQEGAGGDMMFTLIIA